MLCCRTTFPVYLKLFQAYQCHPSHGTVPMPTSALAAVFVCVLGTVMLWCTVIDCGACFKQQRLAGKPQRGLGELWAVASGSFAALTLSSSVDVAC